MDSLYFHQEKVSTYNVKIKRNKVWVSPNAYPEGTAKPGAIITINGKNRKIKMQYEQQWFLNRLDAQSPGRSYHACKKVELSAGIAGSYDWSSVGLSQKKPDTGNFEFGTLCTEKCTK